MTADTRLRDLPAAVRAAMVDGDRGQISAAVAALREYAVGRARAACARCG
jgi:hypothetical protein